MLSFDLKHNNTSFWVINAYAPNVGTPQYFKNIGSHITSAETDYILLSGNLNLILDTKLDCDNYEDVNNPGAQKNY